MGESDSEYSQWSLDFVDWCQQNQLLINAGKTKELVLDLRRCRPTALISVDIQGVNIQIVDSFSYLGIHLNNKLDWSHNTDALYRKSYPSSPNHPPYYGPQPSQGAHKFGYGDPSTAPSRGFNMGYNQGQPPVVYQPGSAPGQGPEYAGQPMGVFQAVVPVGVPPGLEYLAQIDQILIHQKIELLQAFTGFETNNQYEIKNNMGQVIYKAKEKNDCCNRNFCGALRSFDITIKDNMDREVIRIIRPFRCTGCCYPCCLQEMEIQAPPGTTVGFVKQNWHPILPKFSIQGADGETLMKLGGPCCTCICCGDVHFELKGKDDEQSIGRISKQWSGLLKEVFTDADNFGIQFPINLDVKMKAVLMGACFLIDFLFFQKR